MREIGEMDGWISLESGVRRKRRKNKKLPKHVHLFRIKGGALQLLLLIHCNPQIETLSLSLAATLG